LLTFQAGGHPPLRLPEDTEVIETSCNSHSTNDARSDISAYLSFFVMALYL